MYLLGLSYVNARLNGTGQLTLALSGGTLRKWTVLEADDRCRELLRLVVLSCSNPVFLSALSFPFDTLCGAGNEPLRVEHFRVLHPKADTQGKPGAVVAGGVSVGALGDVSPLSTFRGERLYRDFVFRTPTSRAGLKRDFLLAYGEVFSARDGDDDFDFLDPLFRSRRFRSLFSASASLTNPVAFLARLFYRGSRKKRRGPLLVIDRIRALLLKYFGLNLSRWLENTADAISEWHRLPRELHLPLLPVLDAVRHVMDAFPGRGDPLSAPGLIVLDRPDRFCRDDLLACRLAFLDELFPNMQFLTTIPTVQRRLVPEKLLQRELPTLPRPVRAPRRVHRAGPVDVLLIDVDGRLPNPALMKLSRYFKEQGRSVKLGRGLTLIPSARAVYASSIFTSPASRRKVKTLREYYGNSLQLGGSGIDIRRRLPEEIEMLPPDYDLYPELEDRAIGFLSRGCPLHCPFCIVALKEGAPRQVSDLDTLTEGGRRKKLILLDDNLLSLPHSEELLDEIAERGIMVNFTQTLDLRFVNRDKAALLRRVRCSNTRFTRSNYHFSLNDSENLPFVREKYELFGFVCKDNVEFVCMYGYNTTLADDVARFRFLRGLPGAYVFTQRYRPVPGGPSPNGSAFFQGDHDALIGELISIEFTQNMKSMETYYRWVSRCYAETFGKLNMRLVDTIFRYNRRETKGRYIATLAGLDPYRTP